MDDFMGIVVLVLVLVLAVFGTLHLSMDFRHFDSIVAQCEKQGYIQNNTVRLMCTKEKRNADDR
jgi:hypothetical protein